LIILSGFSSPSASAKGSTSNPDHSSRWALLAKPAIGLALAMGVFTAGQAQAMVVNLSEQDWEVIPFTGSYSNNVDEMTSIPTIPPEPPLPECIGPGGRRVWMTAVSGVYPNETITHHYNCVFDFSACSILPLGCLKPPHPDRPTEPPKIWNPEASTWFLVFNPTTGQPFFTNTLVPIDAVWTLSTPFSTSSSTPVPGPLPALGAAAAFGFSRKLRKRINRSSDAVSSTYSL
jgi:hypothetical protein